MYFMITRSELLYDSGSAPYIRPKVTEKTVAASVMVCLIGPWPKTSGSTWDTWEIEKAAELEEKVFGVRLYGTVSCPTHSALTVLKAKVLDWDIDAIVRDIGT